MKCKKMQRMIYESLKLREGSISQNNEEKWRSAIKEAKVSRGLHSRATNCHV
jgi:hypothetical protein